VRGTAAGRVELRVSRPVLTRCRGADRIEDGEEPSPETKTVAPGRLRGLRPLG